MKKNKRKKQYNLFIFIGLCLLFYFPSTLSAKIKVFACEPEWGSLAQEIGGKHVKVFFATHAKQDPHHIRARPSLIAKIRRADLVFCTEAGLEAGGLPILLQRWKVNTQPGRIGYLMAVEYIKLLEKPKFNDRSKGDVHPQGNPHAHLNPYNILSISRELAHRLQVIDSSHKQNYQRYLSSFTKRWKKAIKKWEAEGKALRNRAFLTHHRAWVYFFTWLGLQLENTLEPIPGIPPSAQHLEYLLKQMRQKKIKAIIRTPYASATASQWLENKTNIPAVVLPYTIGGNSNVTNLFDLFTESIRILSNIPENKSKN